MREGERESERAKAHRRKENDAIVQQDDYNEVHGKRKQIQFSMGKTEEESKQNITVVD